MVTHMKTTLELPDDLLIAAKSAAARRRTTLKALVEHALRREIEPVSPSGSEKTIIERGPHGTPRLKRQGPAFITTEMIRDLMDEEGI
jgi:hypothetical protein